MSYRILLVDDEADCLELTRALLLSWNYEVSTAWRGSEAIEKAKAELPDLILLDVHLGGMDGPEVCESLRGFHATRFIPVLMLTVDDQVRRKIDVLGKGADDYLLKTIDPLELKARIETLIRRTLEQSNVNPLTKLPGNLVIEQFIEERLRNKRPFSVCYCDLDNFKAYNDQYGYAAGDRIILHTSRLLEDCAQLLGDSNTFVGHIGGDDFVLVTTPDREELVCKYIVKAFDESILEFYDEQAREQGRVECEDRNGDVQSFPLMSITIAVVNNRGKTFKSNRVIAERAAEIKKYLKQREGSNFHSDRRGGEEKRSGKQFRRRKLSGSSEDSGSSVPVASGEELTKSR